MVPAAALLLAAAPLAAQFPASRPLAGSSTSCATVPDPPRLSAREGALRGTLTMKPGTFTVDGTEFNTNLYGGNYLAPTLVMSPGDRVELDVVDSMRVTGDQDSSQVAWTNQHYHGLTVTPDPQRGDNVTHVRIDRSSGPHHYSFPVPSWHPKGMFWYHPHPHGLTGPQVAGGLTGALLVGSVLDYFPEYRNVPERVLLVRDLTLGGRKATLNVNGEACARLLAAPGERQLWHIGNMGANTFLNLKLEGRKWTVLALDGNRLPAPTPMDSLFLPPGSRAEVIVRGGEPGDSVQFYSDAFDAGGSRAPRSGLGWLVTGQRRDGAPAHGVQGSTAPDAALLDSIRALRTATAVNVDSVVYSFPSGGGAALNDSLYDPRRLDVAVPWGQVQEWTLINNTKRLHTFHIHQTDFLVTEINGVPQHGQGMIDNVALGVHVTENGDTVGDRVKVRFSFAPIAEGPFVFHCHVLKHEDAGMMQNICVYNPNDPDGKRRCEQWFPGGGGGHAH